MTEAEPRFEQIHGPLDFGTGSTPRLLLVSYLFPPSQSVGSLRWEKFASHFATAGWQLDVLTLHPSDLKAADKSRLTALPAGTRVYGVRQPRLAVERAESFLFELLQRARKALPFLGPSASNRSPLSSPGAAPRAESLSRQVILRESQGRKSVGRAFYAWLEFARTEAWASRAVRHGRGVVRKGVHQAVISCGPPHMSHSAGCLLAREFALPFIADFRDPLYLVERLPIHIASPLWYRYADRLERKLVRDASLIVMNTEPARRAMAARHAAYAGRIVCVTNGIDREPVPKAHPTERFIVAYAGSIYLDRDPRPFFRAAAIVVNELGLTPDRFGIELMGNAGSYGGAALTALAEREGIGPFVRLRPPGRRDEALTFLAQASLLLSLPQDSEMAIPSKIFEYMRFSAWLLALAEPSSATGLLLAGTAADVLPPLDVQGIAAVLKARFLAFERGIRPEPIGMDERMSREHQAGLLLRQIRGVIGTQDAPRVPE